MTVSTAYSANRSHASVLLRRQSDCDPYRRSHFPTVRNRYRRRLRHAISVVRAMLTRFEKVGVECKESHLFWFLGDVRCVFIRLVSATV